MRQEENIDLTIYTHPWEPFVPAGARILIMGTFPPGEHRWSMDFYYPNATNDFWKMMGVVFYDDASALYDATTRTYRLDEIKVLLERHHIALHDTAHRIRRLRGTASDDNLEIVEPVDLRGILEGAPDISALCTTGGLASEILEGITGIRAPKMGEMTEGEYLGRKMHFWRMPSTSRQFPRKVEWKAAYYRRMMEEEGVFSF